MKFWKFSKLTITGYSFQHARNLRIINKLSLTKRLCTPNTHVFVMQTYIRRLKVTVRYKVIFPWKAWKAINITDPFSKPHGSWWITGIPLFSVEVSCWKQKGAVMIIDIVKLAAKIYFDSNHSNRQNHIKIDFDYDLNYTKKRKIVAVSL